MLLPTSRYRQCAVKFRQAQISVDNGNKKAQLMLAYPRDAKTMKKIPPFRSYIKFQSSRKSGVYSN